MTRLRAIATVGRGRGVGVAFKGTLEFRCPGCDMTGDVHIAAAIQESDDPENWPDAATFIDLAPGWPPQTASPAGTPSLPSR